MPELASASAGGKVYVTTSVDPEHPGGHALDGKPATFWISTGLYPQELILELGLPGVLEGVRLSCTRVRRVRVEVSRQEEAMNFALVAETELQDEEDGLQAWTVDLPPQDTDRPTFFVRVSILSGWQDFCSVHDISVTGTPMPHARIAAPAPAGRDDGEEEGMRAARSQVRKQTMQYPDRHGQETSR